MARDYIDAAFSTDAMSMPEIKEFSSAVKAGEDWIDDLQRRLGWHDRERAYRALLATLHPLRDSLTRDEAIYVGAQLPPLLRGLYYEGWHPGARGAARSHAAFLEPFVTAYIATLALMAKRWPPPLSPCSRRGSLRRSLKAPRPQRQSRCTTCGQADARLGQ